MAYLDRNRAARLMESHGLDALLLLTPENFTYATGAPAGVAAMWRRAGAFAAIVPDDPAQKEAAVVTDLFENAFHAASPIDAIRINPLWVETGDIRPVSSPSLSPQARIAQALEQAGRPSGFQRPETFDAGLGFGLVAELLAEMRLDKGVIGIELDSLSVTDFSLLKQALPDVRFVDASRLVARLKMVKTKAEIAHLRTAVELSESGIEALARTIEVGVSRDELAAAWSAGVQEAVTVRGIENLTGQWEYVSVGENPWTKGGVVAQGSLIKVDVGCLIAGYTSDTGRTFVCGTPSTLQQSLFGALEEAFEAGRRFLTPGTPMSAVHRVTSQAMAKAGYPGYTRGHFGHGLGASLGSEEWPFFSSDCDVVLEADMVLAFETPWYVDGVGGMIIENQLLITETGHDMMNRLPTTLIAI